MRLVTMIMTSPQRQHVQAGGGRGVLCSRRLEEVHGRRYRERGGGGSRDGGGTERGIEVET